MSYDKDTKMPTTGQDMTHLIGIHSDSPHKRPIAIVEVEVGEPIDIPLGVYDHAKPPKGFMVDFAAEVDKSVVTSKVEVVRTARYLYELRLTVDNRSKDTITVDVWEL
jgi:hypothetical protein